MSRRPQSAPRTESLRVRTGIKAGIEVPATWSFTNVGERMQKE